MTREHDPFYDDDDQTDDDRPVTTEEVFKVLRRQREQFKAFAIEAEKENEALRERLEKAERAAQEGIVRTVSMDGKVWILRS